MTPTKFYTFRQNNSGGTFAHKPRDGIGMALFIEAVDKAHAISRAERIGLYFDGVACGMDCGCCGDRWSAPWDDEGTDTPKQYDDSWRPVEDGETPTLDWGLPSYIHFIGGEFKPAIKATQP